MRSILITGFIFLSCAATGIEDGADDAFTDADGKADGYTLTDAQAAGVLKLVNTASEAFLKNDVGLSSRVAHNIAMHRAGADGKVGTADDNDFDDLAELDAVPYVGPRVFSTLLVYAEAHGYVKASSLG